MNLRFKYLLLIFCCVILTTVYGMARESNSSLRSFRSSDLDMPCGYDKLHNLLSMDVDELIIDEDYTIDSFKGKIDTKIPRIVGEDVKFDVRTDITVNINNQTVPEIFIDAFCPIEYIGGITFCFNGNACRTAFNIRNTASISEIANLSVDGIDIQGYPLRPQTYIIGLNVKLSDGSDVKINNIVANNLSSTANRIIGDSCGNISAIYVNGDAGISSTLELYDCNFSDIHNYDENGNIILEDTNGIYVSLKSPVHVNMNVHIHDIVGVDYGKRLVKTDCSNLLIENITASSQFYDTLSAISLNDGDGKVYYNATIDNVHFTGTTQYVVGSSVPETKISNVFSDITIVPKTYTAAIFPSESCIVENLVLHGAQLIAGVVNTDKNVVIKRVEYDDTMYDHGLYGSALFLTKNAHLKLSDINIKSDKASYLFFDNYPSQLSYTTNVVAEVNNLSFDLNKESKGCFLMMNGQNHVWDVSIKNSSFAFNSPVRGFFCISPTNSDAQQMRLSLEDIKVVYNDLNPSTTIPYGTISYGENTKLCIKNVKIYNNSGKSFNSNVYSLYVTNLTPEITFDKLYISECNLDECKDGKNGIYVTGDDVIWSGGDLITHADPSSIKSLNRKHRKFVYKDTAGRKYKWNGRKWKMVR